MKQKITVFILTFGVFSIINTEMGIVGLLPLLSQRYHISISDAGLMVSLFALVVAFAGPTMPLLFSKMNRKKAMVMVLSVFTLCNIVAAFAPTYWLALLARILPAFFHPIYVSLALSVASTSVEEKEVPKAIANVLIGVSAGMVLGVPIVSFIANVTSLTTAMLCFALVNILALLATIVFVPNQTEQKQLTYGKQLHCLKYPLTWLSILGVVCLNGAIFGVYSFLAEVLGRVTMLSSTSISVMLLLYGFANIVGNIIGGKQLSKQPLRFVRCFPIVLMVVYISMFFLGELTLPMAIITLLWGVLAGAAGNINQYWIASVTKDAPTFGNGLFLAATNLGTTIGTTLCGLYITFIGIHYVVLGGILMLFVSFLLILYRINKYHKVEI